MELPGTELPTGGSAVAAARERRAPTEGEDLLGACLEVIQRDLVLPERYGVLLIGSVAEGFGNSCSDVDVLIVTDEDAPLPAIRTFLTCRDRRIEVLFETREGLAEFARRINRRSPTSEEDLRELEIESLGFYHRVCWGFPLYGADVLRESRAGFNPDHLAALMGAWCARRSRDAARRAVVELHLEQAASSRSWAALAVRNAARSWVAGHYETYTHFRWLSRQLDRAQLDADVRERFDRLTSLECEDAELHLSQCLALASELGVEGPSADGARLRVQQRDGARSWVIGERLHVCREDDVFALSESAARVWQFLENERSLDLAGGEFEAAELPEARKAVGEFHRRGLVEARWEGTDWSWAREDACPEPSGGRVLVTPRGVNPEVLRGAPIRRLPFSARDFVGAGGNVVWSAMMVENAREDAIGAFDAGHWDVVEYALRAMVTEACALLYSAYGLYPLPERHELVDRIGDLDDLDPVIVKEAGELQRLKIRSESDVGAANARIESFLGKLPPDLKEDCLLESHRSAVAWYQTMGLGVGWVIASRDLRLSLPIAEAGDLAGFSRGQITSRLKEEAIPRHIGWRRELSMSRRVGANGV